MNIAWVYFPGSCDDTLPPLCISMVRRLVSASPGKIFGLLERSKWRRYSCLYSCTLLYCLYSIEGREERREIKEKERKIKRGKEANDRLNCEERRRCKKTTGKLGINGHDGERENATEKKNRPKIEKKGEYHRGRREDTVRLSRLRLTFLGCL